jgi:MoaA/NifB/PqqE/SkfB family radical SAM enzyme
LYDKEHDLGIEIELLTKCNFACRYCIYTQTRRKDSMLRDFDKVIDSINALGKKCKVIITGGEPFLYPDFINACKRLSGNNDVLVLSNISSSDVYRFADLLDPTRVTLKPSFHIEIAEQLSLIYDFIRKIKYLRERKFDANPRTVAHPNVLGKFIKYHTLFKQNGITLEAKPFSGTYMLRTYPNSYSADTKKWLSKYVPDNYKKKMGNGVFEPLDFKNKVCKAGKNFIHIDSNGDIHRCPQSEAGVTNIYKGGIRLSEHALPCKEMKCFCREYGMKLRV